MSTLLQAEGVVVGLALAPWKSEFDGSLQRRIEVLAEELARQAADIAAAEYRWLALLGEFDELGGWAEGGARSCAAWLSWACGLSLPAARERVRVAKALRGLPLVSAAFAAGRMSFSKVRAVTRVATPENEATLVDYAASATAAQLEVVTRGYRRSQSSEEEATDAHRQFERRSVRHWVDDDGYVRISARLAPDDGALIVAQLERLAESGGEDQPAPPAASGQDVSAETAEAGRGDAPVVGDRFASDPADARRADALRMMAETAAATGPVACVGGETHLVVWHVRNDELAHEVSAGGAYAAADPATDIGIVIEGVGRVSAETARRVACDAQVVAMVEDALGRPLGVGRTTAKVPRWLRRALRRRDRGCCRFPGCSATRFIDAHHIQHWADGGPTDLANLVLLCRFHHRLVHEVGYTIDVLDPGQFRFRRPNGTPVPHIPAAATGAGDAIEKHNQDLGLRIDALTGIPDWDGHPPDYSAAIEHLHNVAAEMAADAV